MVTRNTLADINGKVAELDTVAKSSATALFTLGTKSDAIHSAQMTTNTKLGDIHSTLSSMPQNVRDIASHVSTVEGNVLSAVQESTQMIAELQRVMQTLVEKTTSPNNGTLEGNIAAMMVSKPSLLRDAHGIVGSDCGESQPTPPGLQERHQYGPWMDWHRNREKQCGCWLRRKVTQSKFCVLSISLPHETIVEMQHTPDCPSARIARVEIQRKISILYTGLRRILSTAVSASFHLSYGAGGYSISPTFRYFAMVDPEKSPAFRLATVLICYLWLLENVGTQEEIANHFYSNLRRIYDAGYASPTDVDEDGNTLENAIAEKVRFNQQLSIDG